MRAKGRRIAEGWLGTHKYHLKRTVRGDRDGCPTIDEVLWMCPSDAGVPGWALGRKLSLAPDPRPDSRDRECARLRRLLACTRADAPTGVGALALVRAALQTREEETTLDAARRWVDDLTEARRCLGAQRCDVCRRLYSEDPEEGADPCYLADHLEAFEALGIAPKGKVKP